MAKVYAKLDANGNVLAVDSDFINPGIGEGITALGGQDADDWVWVAEGEGDRFNLAQSHWFDKPILTYELAAPVPRYWWNSKVNQSQEWDDYTLNYMVEQALQTASNNTTTTTTPSTGLTQAQLDLLEQLQGLLDGLNEEE